MKFLRENFAYILLALVAVLLILVTINLQMAILARQDRGEDQVNRGFLYTLRQQVAELILPATDTPATTTQPAAPTPLPTNTPLVIVVQPTQVAAMPTAAPVTPMPTAAVVVPAPVGVVGNPTITATTMVIPRTATSSPTAFSATPAPPAAVTTAVDFRLGYVEQSRDCVAVTNLMQLILERNFNLRVATVAFPDSVALFEKLAAKTETARVDLTFCYVDPTDRRFLQQYFGFMIFVGSGYRQVEDQKFIIMSNAAVKSPIERGNPCLYRFLTRLNLNDFDWSMGDAATWYQAHADQITSLTRCE